MNVTDAVQHRCSTRAFRSDPVSNIVIRDIIEQARWAPSGGNLQAWHVHIVTGTKHKDLVAAAQKQFDITPEGDPADHHPYPANFEEPYRNRRRAVGRQLYDIVGVARDDRSGKLKYLRRNYEFFDAPIGLFFAIDRQMEPLQWVDLGIFIQTIMLLAVERGLSTCCQGAWSLFAPVIRETLHIPDHDIIACGMAMGYVDETAPINKLRSERAGLEEIATFYT